MDNLRQLSALCGRLDHIFLVEWIPEDYDPAHQLWLEAVDFVFEGHRCLVRAVGADDSIRVVVKHRAARYLRLDTLSTWRKQLGVDDWVVHDASGHAPWDACLDKSLLWAWSMTNNNGYQDAVQFELTTDLSTTTTIQLVTVASQLHLRVVEARALELD